MAAHPAPLPHSGGPETIAGDAAPLPPRTEPARALPYPVEAGAGAASRGGGGSPSSSYRLTTICIPTSCMTTGGGRRHWCVAAQEASSLARLPPPLDLR
jgi:hypothetical protein